ncbi:MAG: NADH:flavin oxidoreductase [Bacteroidales bacterium]|nr:NADH:flavin oxidoreductase [Bacteroidota bacterium]MBL6950493.1 NADH:flavin oxidoreductase [Bacteroidales bacterium]
MDTPLFTPAKLGPLTLRNRSIRAAAFEGMSPGHMVSDDLIDYHRAVSAGGVAMTTVAYAAVSQSGLSFDHQLWLRKEAVPGLKKLTDAVHAEGSFAAIQIGHCGLMAKKSVSGGLCFAPSGKFNLYGPTWPKTMTREEIKSVVTDFGRAVNLSREAGFDGVEVHAGHGYLISQFLSLYTNKRKDEYGESFENRTRFMREVIQEVMKAAGKDITVVVKMNLRDGFHGGMEMDESIEVARLLESEGVHGLVLSGGFVSKAPMHVMRGRMPVDVMAAALKKDKWMKPMLKWFGSMLMKPEPFSEGYFLEDALKVRDALTLPLIYVGGLVSLEKIGEVLGKGFEFVQIARALINDPAFINKLKSGEITRSDCKHSNYCIAVMYSGKMKCFQHVTTPYACLIKPSKWSSTSSIFPTVTKCAIRFFDTRNTL